MTEGSLGAECTVNCGNWYHIQAEGGGEPPRPVRRPAHAGFAARLPAAGLPAGAGPTCGSLHPHSNHTPGPAWMDPPDLTPMQAAFAGAPDPEIVALEARLRAAQLAADVEALDSLISDALLFTGPDGRLGTKADDLAAYRSGAVRFRAHEPEELRVRRIGADVAVSALRARLAVEVGGALSRGTDRYTRVWAREDGGSWRVVGGHVGEVPGTPGAGPSSS